MSDEPRKFSIPGFQCLVREIKSTNLIVRSKREPHYVIRYGDQKSQTFYGDNVHRAICALRDCGWFTPEQHKNELKYHDAAVAEYKNETSLKAC